MAAESNASARPVVFGEVFVRQTADGMQPDGLPFNVAWHLRGLGLDPLLVSSVGSGTAGVSVLETMRAWGMDPAGIQFDLELPEVAAAGGGAAVPLPDRAYPGMDTSLAVAALRGSNWSLLYHTPSAPGTALKVAFEAVSAASGAPLFLDGAPWEGSTQAVPWPATCRWLKLTRAQLREISGAVMDDLPSLLAAAQELRRRRELALLIVTDSEQGSYSFSEHGMDFAPAAPGRPAETNGAFSAACIAGLARGWPWHTLLSRACELAVAVRPHAARPDRSFYDRVLEGWSR